MIEAEIRDKLSSREDRLTSAVFGLLRYLPLEIGFLPWLRCARCFGTAKPLFNGESPINVHVTFWPITESYGIPDALLTFHTEAEPHIVVVEAKLGSPKSQWDAAEDDLTMSSDQAPHREPADMDKPELQRDQLARYWDAVRFDAFRSPLSPAPASRKSVLFLTEHHLPPHSSIEESLIAANIPFPLHWLSWRHLATTLRSALPGLRPADCLIVNDVLRLLDHHGFLDFVGVCPVSDGLATGRLWRFANPSLDRRFSGFAQGARLIHDSAWRFPNGKDPARFRGFRFASIEPSPSRWVFRH